MSFIKQYKGKDLDKIPASKLLTKDYIAGIKYDGNYVQIHKIGDKVTFYTSSGKPFYLEDVAEDLVKFNDGLDFIIEAEYIANTDGKLGSRGKCTTTTYRTNSSKGILNRCKDNKFKAFDLLYLARSGNVVYDCKVDDNTFEDRIDYFHYYGIDLGLNIDLVEFKYMSLKEAKAKARELCNEGFEGLFLFHQTHTWADKGRSNLAVKLKMRPTADLLCIGTTEGEGKYAGMIGSLVLVDAYSREVSVGSGLCDIARQANPSEYVNKIIEIEYEQILDTYIQPTYVGIRADKSMGDMS